MKKLELKTVTVEYEKNRPILYNDPQFLEGRQPKVSQENYVELTAASAIPNKEIKSPQILRY